MENYKDMINSRILASAQSNLLSASNDLFIRSEVSSLLNSVLADVETQHALREQYSHQKQIDNVKKQLRLSQNELEERRALHNASLEKRQELGDKFVGELFVLSVKLQELELWRKDNFEKVQKFDQLQRDLERAEETVRSLKRSRSLNANNMRDPSINDSNTVPNTDNKIANEAKSKEYASPEDRTPDKEESEEINNNLNAEPTKDKGEPMISESEPNLVEKEKIEAIASMNTSVPKKASPRKEKVQKKKRRYPKASFTNLKDEVLLEIFAFLDAVEVIQAAQVNKAFYSKVNSMFGNVSSVDLEESVVVIEDEDDYDESEDEDDYDESEDEVETKDEDTNLNDQSQTAQNLEHSKSVSSKNANAPITATIVAIPPKSTSTASLASSASSKTANRTATIGNNPLSNMFSNILQPKPNTSNNITGTSTAASYSAKPQEIAKPPSNSTNSQTNPGGLTASMANSMTSKLSPSELSVIISMTEKISRITAEREDLAARLEGTEAVKEFLISKVRDAELALATKSSESVAITQQTASDQEVIAFLDGRVQELERSYNETTKAKTKAEEEFKKFQTQSSQKIKVIEDMLQFERQQLADQEKEWKVTKKVLVKEVKHCRAQIATLQAERDSFYHQNERLKQALLTLNGSGANIERSPRLVGKR